MGDEWVTAAWLAVALGGTFRLGWLIGAARARNEVRRIVAQARRTHP